MRNIFNSGMMITVTVEGVRYTAMVTDQANTRRLIVQRQDGTIVYNNNDIPNFEQSRHHDEDDAEWFDIKTRYVTDDLFEALLILHPDFSGYREGKRMYRPRLKFPGLKEKVMQLAERLLKEGKTEFKRTWEDAVSFDHEERRYYLLKKQAAHLRRKGMKDDRDVFEEKNKAVIQKLNSFWNNGDYTTTDLAVCRDWLFDHDVKIDQQFTLLAPSHLYIMLLRLMKKSDSLAILSPF